MSYSPSLHPNPHPPLSSALLGPPSNAHYSPHYGATPARAPTSKRKPPPPINPLLDPPNLSLSPNNNSLSSLHSPSLDHSPSPRDPTRDPSPSPSPRPANLARKIGSVLSAPFRAGSRRGSDLSDLALGLAECRLSTSSNRFPPPPDHLPSMPSPTTPDGPRPASSPHLRAMTPAERVAHAARTSDAIVVVPRDERVLRVVNGTATTSTRASSAPPADIDSTFQPLQGSALSMVSCARCSELDARLDAQAQRTSALERLVADQTARLEQTRNWATAKVATLEQALRAHERLLEGLEGRVYAHEDQPDVKSDYLIGLQRDVYDLAARMGLVEQRLPRAPEGAQSSRSSSEAEMASTKPTSISTTPPLASISPHLSGTPIRARSPVMPAQETPNRTRVWHPSSPAHLASKLVSPKSASRLSPQTPSSRSPRPRYTTALGLKPTSPLNFTPSNSAQRLRGRTSETSPSASWLSISNPTTPARRPSVSNPTTPAAGMRRAEVGGPRRRDSRAANGNGESREGSRETQVGARWGDSIVGRMGGGGQGSPTSQTMAPTRMAFGTRVVAGAARTESGGVTGYGGTSGGLSNNRMSRPLGGVGGGRGLNNGGASGVGLGVVGGKKKPVGDLIKMFDGGQKG